MIEEQLDFDRIAGKIAADMDRVHLDAGDFAPAAMSSNNHLTWPSLSFRGRLGKSKHGSRKEGVEFRKSCIAIPVSTRHAPARTNLGRLASRTKSPYAILETACTSEWF